MPTRSSSTECLPNLASHPSYIPPTLAATHPSSFYTIKTIRRISIRCLWQDSYGNMRPKGPTPTHSPSTAPSVTRFSHGVLQMRLSGKMDPHSLSPATPRNGKGDTPSSALGRLRPVRALPPLLLPHPMLVGGIRTTWVRVWTRMWLGVKLRPWLKDK
jgi:hypothetical protein